MFGKTHKRLKQVEMSLEMCQLAFSTVVGILSKQEDANSLLAKKITKLEADLEWLKKQILEKGDGGGKYFANQ